MNLNLNYEGFENYLIEKRTLFNGVQYIFRFENKYGASVIKHDGSYGHEKDLWELAVIYYKDDARWNLVYDTPVTADVEGCLTDSEVKELLKKIKELQSPQLEKTES